MSMNHSEEASLSGTAPQPSISRRVIEDLVLINTFDNAPQSLYTTTPVGSCLRSTRQDLRHPVECSTSHATSQHVGV